MTGARSRDTAAGSAANLSIELTTRCTSACPYCFARAGLSGDASLPLDAALAICEEGFAAGFRHLHLTGGEPLLWQDLFALLDEAFERGYASVFLNTNGLLLTGAVVARLAAYPDLVLSVSLQGFADLHDRMRGPDSHRRVSRGIRRALDAGLALVIFTTVGKTLLAQLPAFARDLYDQFDGIRQLTLIQLIRVRNDACDLAAELLAPEEFVQLVRTVSALNLCGLPADLLNNPLANVVAARLHLPRVPQSHALCRPERLMIRADRNIVLAHSTPEIIGQYRPGMITKALTCDGYRQAVAQDNTTCPMCPYIDQCRPHGMLHPSPPVMDMQPEVPYCQRVLAGIQQPG
jgi:MoaA/NifB/PqqE/SkfB family radical SAM enzyme